MGGVVPPASFPFESRCVMERRFVTYGRMTEEWVRMAGVWVFVRAFESDGADAELPQAARKMWA